MASIKLIQYLAKHMYAIAVLAMILVSILALLLMNSLRQRLNLVENGSLELKPGQYQYILIAEQVDSPFWLEAYQGARAAAAQVGAVVELAGSEKYTADRSAELIKIATAARLDGIATCVVDPDLVRQAIDAAVDTGIPVVTMGYDAVDSKRQCFIGVNGYDLGHIFGKLLATSVDNSQIVALVSKDPTSSVLSEDQIIAGLRDYLAEYPGLSLNTLEIDRTSAFSADNAIRDLLIKNQTPVSTIISLNVDDTLRVAETLTEYGQTTNILCYQENTDILEYIKSGLIQAALASDPYKIGYDSIMALAEIKKNNRTNEYIPSSIVTITAANVSEYEQASQQLESSQPAAPAQSSTAGSRIS